MDRPRRRIFSCDICEEVFIAHDSLIRHQRELPQRLDGPLGSSRPALELELGVLLKKLEGFGDGVILHNSLIGLRAYLQQTTGITIPAVKVSTSYALAPDQWCLRFRRRLLMRDRFDADQLARLAREELCASYYGSSLICRRMQFELPNSFWKFLTRGELRDTLAEMEISDPDLAEETLRSLDQELLLKLLRLLLKERFSMNRLPALLEVLLEEQDLGRPLSLERLVTPAVLAVMLEP
jgi:flagellar biosynthesis component FlhA